MYTDGYGMRPLGVTAIILHCCLKVSEFEL